MYTNNSLKQMFPSSTASIPSPSPKNAFFRSISIRQNK